MQNCVEVEVELCSAECSSLPVKALWGKSEIGKFVAGASTSRSITAPTKNSTTFELFHSDLASEQNKSGYWLKLFANNCCHVYT